MFIYVHVVITSGESSLNPDMVNLSLISAMSKSRSEEHQLLMHPFPIR